MVCIKSTYTYEFSIFSGLYVRIYVATFENIVKVSARNMEREQFV